MLIKPTGVRGSPIPHNQMFVNSFSVISPEGFNARNKDFVKRVINDFIEKNLEPEAQNALAVNRFLKNYQDSFQRG